MSEHIERIHGFPVAEFAGNKVRNYGWIIHPGDRSYAVEEIDRVRKNGSPRTLASGNAFMSSAATWHKGP
jgi:hypothetical protein